MNDAREVSARVAQVARAARARVDWASVPRADLLATHRELVAARRQLDALLAEASHEIARRSTADDGAAGLARREGFATPQRLVAAVTGGSEGEARRLIAVGAITRNRPGDDARLGARPAIGAAVREGRISIDAAGAIAAMLDEAGTDAPESVVAHVERDLVHRAQSLPLSRVHALVRMARARLDAAGHAQRERERHEARYLSIVETGDGMVSINGRLDVETAAPVIAVIDGVVAESLRRRRDACGSGTSAADGLGDARTVPQMRADALADVARHALGCESRDVPLAPTTTVMVRMGLDELRSGEGFGQIDGIDEPVSAAVCRRMASAANVIPVVLGGDSEVLDFGRTRRLFSPAQRLALGERDGGCAYCHAPPSWTEAHHIRWWERDAGPTDLANGVLLCTACHHRIHRDGWDIEIRARGDANAHGGDGRDGGGGDEGGSEVWFTPPASIDPTRTPTLGGRARFDYARAA